MTQEEDIPRGLVMTSVRLKNTFIEDTEESWESDMTGGACKAKRQSSAPAPPTSKLIDPLMTPEILNLAWNQLIQPGTGGGYAAAPQQAELPQPEKKQITLTSVLEQEEADNVSNGAPEPEQESEPPCSGPHFSTGAQAAASMWHNLSDNRQDYMADTRQDYMSNGMSQCRQDYMSGTTIIDARQYNAPQRSQNRMWTAAPVDTNAVPWATNQPAPTNGRSDSSAASANMRLAVAALIAANGASNPPQAQAWNNVYTVMMRNLPNKVTQKLLLSEINDAGFLGSYDFVYLPIDAETDANRGYSFINFITPGWALMFRMHYEGRKFGDFNSDKVVSVVPALLQGYDANAAHYSSTRVSHGNPAERPLFLRESTLKTQHGNRHKDSLIDLAAKQLRKNRRNVQQQNQYEPQYEPQAESQAGYRFSPNDGSAMYPNDNNAARPPFTKCAGAEEDADFRSRVPKFCPYCGGPFQPDFKFCEFCGSSIRLN